MKILVTGGAGFLGSHLCDRLIAEGHEVWCLDNLETGSLSNLASAMGSERFHFIEGDVRDPFPEIVVERVYNLACPAAPLHYQRDPIGTMRTSVLGALNALEYCRRNGVRLLQTSTSEVYGDPTVHPQPEDYVGSVNCTGIRACYDEGKRAAETLCYDYHRQYGLEIRVARLFNTYGPRMCEDDGRVVSNFIIQALRGEPLTVYGAGEQTRSFCYVDDTIAGLVALMEAPGQRVGPLNLGNPGEFTVRELADLVLEKTRSTSTIHFGPLPQDDPRVRRPVIAQAEAILGWRPTISLSEGLDRSIPWYIQNIVKPGATAPHVAIVGGGPAGLTAAYELQKLSKDHRVTVFEASNAVGGIARTEVYKGYRFDIGGHRFFSKVSAVTALWREVLRDDFKKTSRMSRIYYRGKYYNYPLKVGNALHNMGVYESVRIVLSYLKWQVLPSRQEVNLRQWVTNRFGGRLFLHFFKSYTEKVWGMPCDEIQADWAAQRIKSLSLHKAIINAFTGRNETTSLIESFDYPRLGPGMMWEAFRDRIVAAGGAVRMQSKVSRIHHEGGRVTAIEVETPDAAGRIATEHVKLDELISSMPLRELVLNMEPPAPPPVRAAAESLKFRDFLIVTLLLNNKDPFPDNWVYIHSPDVQVGRIQNFRAWSEEMVPDPNTSSIGMEYFCQQDDQLWAMSDSDLVALATREAATLGLLEADDVFDGAVIRQEKAYPVYDADYGKALEVIREWLAGLSNLQAVGRNGMHRYNNQDHSMMTAMLAVGNILGERHDLWSVNVDEDYHEEIDAEEERSQPLAAA